MARKVIKMRLSHDSIQQAIKQLQEYENALNRKTQILVDRLAKEGLRVVQTTMEAIPSEEKGDYYTEIVNTSKGTIVGAAIYLTGNKVLFLEFSAGITYGTSDYPLPSGDKYGMGTYPSDKGNWDKPGGWWYVDETGEKHHSYGNRAYMPMYHAEQAIIFQIRHMAKEIFGGN